MYKATAVLLASVSDPYSLYPDPVKNRNPDPRCFLTLPGINIKLFINIRFSNLKKSSERYTGNVLKLKLFCGDSFKTLDPEPDLENPGSGFETLVLANCPFPTCKIAWPCEMQE